MPPLPTNLPGEDNLPFVLIETDEYGVGRLGDQPYALDEPGFFVVATAAQLADLPTAISPEGKQQLTLIDFEHSLVLAVYQGRKLNTGYGVQIDAIRRLNTTITVFATFIEPQPGQQRGALVTSPYAIVAVEKSGDFGNDFEFILNVGGKRTTSLTQFVP